MLKSPPKGGLLRQAETSRKGSFFALLFVLYKKQGEKARGACRPGRDTAAGGKVFCPTFCVLQKVGKKSPQGGERI